MRVFRFVFLLFCCSALAKTGLASPAGDGPAHSPLVWEHLENGLALARVTLQIAVPAPEEHTVQDRTDAAVPARAVPLAARVSVLRINPDRFSFSLYMASEKGPKPLADICRDEHFVAAINAGMFLPDGMTSTGYLRQGAHVNNGHMAANFGAFFAAMPRNAKLPRARLIDKTAQGWQNILEEYSLVMQNYRMTTPAGRIIWKPAKRPHSIAALSQDEAGNILFIFCADPVPATEFITALLALPLQAASVMYLEGGSEAAMAINAGNVSEMRTGRHASGLWSGGARLEVPNVLGVTRRTR